MSVLKRSIPIKYKVFLLLMGLPLITLSIYLLLAKTLFEKDKIAYVYDAGVTLARGTAAQIFSEINSLTESITPLVAQYDPVANKFR